MKQYSADTKFELMNYANELNFAGYFQKRALTGKVARHVETFELHTVVNGENDFDESEEPVITYILNSDGSFSYFAAEDWITDAPAHVANIVDMREVIDGVRYCLANA